MDPRLILKLDLPLFGAQAQRDLDAANVRALYSADLSWFTDILIVTRSWQELPQALDDPIAAKAMNAGWFNEKGLILGRTLFPVIPTEIDRGYSSPNDYRSPAFYAMALQELAQIRDRYQPDATYLDTQLYGQAHCLPIKDRALTAQEQADVADAVDKAATYLPPTAAGSGIWHSDAGEYTWWMNGLYQRGVSGEHTWYARTAADVAPVSAPPHIADPNDLLTYWGTFAAELGDQDAGGGKMRLLPSEIRALDLVVLQATYPNLDGVVVHIPRDKFASVMATW